MSKQALRPMLKRYRLVWSLEGRTICEVKARDASSAKRKAPKPYKKYLGEIYAELVG